MSKVTKMSLKDILDQIEPMIIKENIMYFFKDMTKAMEFIEKYEDIIENSTAIEPKLLENERYIDKEKFVLVLMLNYKENILAIGHNLDELAQRRYKMPEDVRMVELLKLKKELEKQNKVFDILENMGKGIKKFLIFYYYDESQKRYRITLIKAKEIIDEEKINNIKALKKFEEIDNNFKNRDQSGGLEFVLQSLLLTDLYEICSTVELGDMIRTMVLDNNILKKGYRTVSELEELRNNQEQSEYNELVENIDFREVLTDLKLTLKEYPEYINMDKLLLISSFRFLKALENNDLDADACPNINIILQQILNNINDKKVAIDTELQIKKNGVYELEKVKYSVKDLKKMLSRFVGDNYISLKEIEEYGGKVKEAEMNLLELPQEYIDVIFSKEELKQIALLSEENLIYVAGKLNWENVTILNSLKQIGTCNTGTIAILMESGKISVEELIGLYELDIVSLDSIKELKDILDFTETVNFEAINNIYLQLKRNPENKEFLRKYKRYMDLYKEIHINKKSKEELEENANESIAIIIENFAGDDYDNAIKEYYRKGLITLDSIAEWSNEDLLIKLYNEQLISLRDLEGLAQKGKIGENHIVEIYEKAIWNNTLSQEQRVDMLSKGWISIETIEKLFRKNLLDKEDLRILVEENIISEENKIEIIESLSLEEAEANSSISLVIDDNIKKIHGKERESEGTNYHYNPTCAKDKIIISPNAREEFFKLLGAKKVKTSKIDEDNPFYNYQFYIMPGKDGKIHLNSPVIAERYYEDKETERTFATENATYFFQYGNLMVLSNYAKKDEVVGKKENVVFRSTHTIANEKRKGKWASSVIGNVVRALLSSDLKEYNSENQKLIILAKLKEKYTPKQIMKILSFEEEIDCGKHLCGVIKEKSAPNFDDSDNGLR